MYGIFSYIYHTNQLNVGKYSIHGSYGICLSLFVDIKESVGRKILFFTGRNVDGAFGFSGLNGPGNGSIGLAWTL